MAAQGDRGRKRDPLRRRSEILQTVPVSREVDSDVAQSRGDQDAEEHRVDPHFPGDPGEPEGCEVVEQPVDFFFFYLIILYICYNQSVEAAGKV